MSDQPDPIPPNDLSRRLTIARPAEDQSLLHIGLVGDTYTILVADQDTAGRCTLIDMHVPPGGGPPPHWHDFEEIFTILDGEVLVTFRGRTITARAGETVNVPANAPHSFTNAAGTPSRLLCMCAPLARQFKTELLSPPGSDSKVSGNDIHPGSRGGRGPGGRPGDQRPAAVAAGRRRAGPARSAGRNAGVLQQSGAAVR
ncbi:MAG TPA: cupin domain-containing protein [Streptosporangiaceae bacterium]|nr:cupin domain-containing protein [Streptosporangiaceae bacterium]